MKTIIASLFLVMAAVSGNATPGLSMSGTAPEYVEVCPTTPPPNPVPATGGCREGDICPMGYEPVERWCWDDWSMKVCGVQCKNNHLWD